MKFNIQINNETIRQAAALVMSHYKDDDFITSIECHGSFNHTTDRGYTVADKIRLCNIEMNVVAYTTRLPWSKVIGHAKGNTIYCNTRKFNLPLKDRVQNFFHEPMHLLGYHHKGNKVNAFNLQTVPYKSASIFVKYLESIGKL